MRKDVKPFLWNHLENIEKSPTATHGEERIGTESANEENRSNIIELFSS